MSVLTEGSTPRKRRKTISQTGRSYCGSDNTTHVQREADAGVGDSGSFWAGKEVDMYSAHDVGTKKKIAEQHR
jgi:hypothetical protein